MWQKLSDAEWRQHELNRFRGWVLAIILLNSLALILIPTTLWLSIAYPDPEFSLAKSGRPALADILGNAVGTIGGVVSLIAIWTRHYRAPEIYLVATLVAALVGIGIQVTWRDPEL